MRTLSVSFLIPVFGVLWGAVLLDEPVGWTLLVGGALISWELPLRPES